MKQTEQSTPRPRDEETLGQTLDQDRPEANEQDAPTIASDPIPMLEIELPSNWTVSPVEREQSNSLPIPEEAAVAALTAVRNSDDPTGAEPTLLALKVPRHNLSLEEYITGVTEGLSERVDVKRAGIRFDARADGHPIGVIEYGNEKISGYQIVQFDTMAENLILLTFTAPTAELGGYLQEFEQVATAITAE